MPPALRKPALAADEPTNLVKLQIALRIGETGSASEAARTLFRAQSVITRAVQELERTLGASLFERGANGMVPTADGKVVLARATRVFAELSMLAQWCAVRRTRTRPIGPATADRVPAYLLNARRLQLLIALARHRHMPTTAAAMHVTQPAVSHAIKVLETGAGLPLFHRSGRGLLLTTEGETVVLHARRALNELRHIRDDLAAFHGSVQGQVVVGALPLGRTLILPDAIALLSRDHPGVRIVTDESAYEPLVVSLRAGDVDFILGALRPADPNSGLVLEPLISEPLTVLVRRDHPLLAKTGLRLADLTHERWILPRSHAPARLLFDGLFTRKRLRAPQPVVETADLAVIRGLLLKTDMIAALSARQLHFERESGQLDVLDIVDMPARETHRQIGLTLRAASEPSPAAARLIEAIRTATRAHPA
ncbi:LysR family transcriptional regulator [Robbsia sp. KACC 23696]|uniref:LysR family transcriptional regulator n=1 Tax=Robbsia sp. KACC 23696 TaxID=3149231 RepID=UPI00325B92E8